MAGLRRMRCRLFYVVAPLILTVVSILLFTIHSHSRNLQSLHAHRSVEETTRPMVLGLDTRQFYAPQGEQWANHNETSCELTGAEEALYPNCINKIKEVAKTWRSDPCLQYHRVDGSDCSILNYLYKTTKDCPYKPMSYNEEAVVQTDKAGLMHILVDPNPRQAYAWIRMRINQFFPHWVDAVHHLETTQELRGRKRKHILLYLGVASKRGGTGFVEIQFKGGPLGELVQWTDLILTLYILGHKVTVTSEAEQLINLARKIEARDSACQAHKEFPYDIIYTDYIGYAHVKTAFKGILKHRCKFRILDTFGTEPKYNLHDFVDKSKNPWGGHDFQPKQIFTTFPHTADNSAMGFTMQALINDSEAKSIPRLNQVLIYGKTDDHLKDKTNFLQVFKDLSLEVHTTIPTSGLKHNTLPDFAINHGLLHGNEIHHLLRQSKIFVGLGYPVEGPAPLEAIANGAVYLNPKHIPPIGKGAPGWGVKPTSRELTSQQTYAEQFIGEPFAYTIDINNLTEVKLTIEKILKLNKFESYLPYELSPEGMLQRMNAYLEHQNFCKWPPEGSISFILGEAGQTCTQTCWKQDYICEPVHFETANWKEALQAAGASCSAVETKSDVFYPGFDFAKKTCILQGKEILFSCAEGSASIQRLCPCRTYVKGQHALCPGCVDVLT